MSHTERNELSAPKTVDRAAFEAALQTLRIREKAHTREGDAIAAARRRLPMVKVDGAAPLIGEHGKVTLLDAFEDRRMLIAYYFMWSTGRPAAEQCEGCTWVTSHIQELSYIHSRDVTFAVLCKGPYEESARYRDFMGWTMPWYSAQGPLGALLPGGRASMIQLVLLPATRIVCLRDLLDDGARRRSDGEQLSIARHDRLRPSGDVGGFARRLAAGEHHGDVARQRASYAPNGLA